MILLPRSSATRRSNEGPMNQVDLRQAPRHLTRLTLESNLTSAKLTSQLDPGRFALKGICVSRRTRADHRTVFTFRGQALRCGRGHYRPRFWDSLPARGRRGMAVSYDKLPGVSGQNTAGI